MYEVVIIGGMAAGCKAAARLSRLSPDYRITIVEKSSFVSFSSCGLPLYTAGELNDLSDLNKTPYGVTRDKNYFQEIKDVKILVNTEANNIDVEKKKVNCYCLDDKKEFNLPYDYLIFATGAKTINPNFSFPLSSLISSFHSPSDSIYFRQAAQKGKIEKAAIIGGGFVGCELIEALSSLWGIETVLIEKESSLLDTILDPEISSFIENEVSSDKNQLLLSSTVDKIEINEIGSPVIYLKNGQQIVTDYVFYCLGVRPNIDLAVKSNLKIGSCGGIVVDDQMRTNISNIWAAGDCVEIKNLVTNRPDYFPFGSLSNRMGRVAADSIAGIESQRECNSFEGVVGTVSLKLFDNIICAAGISEKKARNLGYNAGSVIGNWYDRPDYIPEAKNILGKLIYEKPGLKLLGLQLVGAGEVTRYMDVFSELLSNNKKVEDLLNVEHGYTPAHSLPVSPLNYLGYMALNQEKDGVKNFNPSLLSSFTGIFIDVREPFETEVFSFTEKSIQIPLSELRLRIKDFDADQPIMFVCEKGMRAYEAARMFINFGYKNVSYLGGGNLLYHKMNKFSKFLETNYE